MQEEKENHFIQQWMPLVSPELEYEEITSVKTCLKKVSVFANYRDGEIIGVTDSGKVTGVEVPFRKL